MIPEDEKNETSIAGDTGRSLLRAPDTLPDLLAS
jgi:hypothetical protein